MHIFDKNMYAVSFVCGVFGFHQLKRAHTQPTLMAVCSLQQWQLFFGCNKDSRHFLLLSMFLLGKVHVTLVMGSVELVEVALFLHEFTLSVVMILAMEIGEKTFFIAAVLRMCNDCRAILGGAILALIIRTILSSMIGLVRKLWRKSKVPV
jgi:hypothetical protein